MKAVSALAGSGASEVVEHTEKPCFRPVQTQLKSMRNLPDCSRVSLQGIIRGRAGLESVIHSDGWRGMSLSTRPCRGSVSFMRAIQYQRS